MNKNVFPAMLIIGALFISGCVQQHEAPNGFIEGVITIGPLCPVENPSNPSCRPTAETYRNWPIAVWAADKKNQGCPVGAGCERGIQNRAPRRRLYIRFRGASIRNDQWQPPAQCHNRIRRDGDSRHRYRHGAEVISGKPANSTLPTNSFRYGIPILKT